MEEEFNDRKRRNSLTRDNRYKLHERGAEEEELEDTRCVRTRMRYLNQCNTYYYLDGITPLTAAPTDTVFEECLHKLKRRAPCGVAAGLWLSWRLVPRASVPAARLVPCCISTSLRIRRPVSSRASWRTDARVRWQLNWHASC